MAIAGDGMKDGLPGTDAANTIQRFGCGDTVECDPGGDTVIGGAGDTVVHVGIPSGYKITVAEHTLDLERVTRITVMDTTTGDGETNEGTDTLTGFKAVRFGSATTAVALEVISATSGTVTGGGATEILVGSTTAGVADTLNGMGGADPIFGLGRASLREYRGNTMERLSWCSRNDARPAKNLTVGFCADSISEPRRLPWRPKHPTMG